MANTDSISDMIVRLLNAAQTSKENVSFLYSKLALAIATVLEKEGYIELLPKKGKKAHKYFEAKVVYHSGVPKVKGAQRISKLSKRLYSPIADIAPVKNGHGHTILSTPKGILTDKEARKENVGGEVLFQVW